VPKQTFTIKSTGQVVEVERNLFGRNIVVKLEGREIGRFKSLRALKEGEILKTPIGDIHMEYKQSQLGGSGLDVFYNNDLLSGSHSEPARLWRQGYQVALFLGVFNIVIGLIALSSKSTFLTALGAGPYSLIFGVVLVILGLWSRQLRSAVALGIAAFIFGADGALGLLMLMSAGVPPNVFGLMVRVGFVALMAMGANAAWGMEPEPEYEKVKNSF
jgi:hypothetical protein